MKYPVKKRNGETIYMLIDSEDLDLIKDLNLIQVNPKNSNTTYIKSVLYEKGQYIKTIHIHRLVMGIGDFKDDKRIINHINGNGWDNRKKNLEICDLNHNNLSINRPNGKCGYIYFENCKSRKKKYRLVITINKKTLRKRFMTYNEANLFRLKYLREVYGEDLVHTRIHNKLINEIEKEVKIIEPITISFD